MTAAAPASRRGPVVAAAGGVALAAAALPARAQAHGLSARSDLPLPDWLFSWAAALVLIASFAGLAALWPRPQLEPPTRVLGQLALAPWFVPAAGAVGIAAFALTVVAGLAGPQDAAGNLAPTMVYVVVWVGIPVVSALVGDVFAALSPWRSLARAAAWARGRRGRRPPRGPRPYPARLGSVPAAAGLVAFAWVELVWERGSDPSTLALLLCAYAATMLTGIAVFGEAAWSGRADPLGVAFGLFARISPVRTEGGRLVLRAPLAGLAALRADRGSVAVVCVLIGATCFDGLAQGTAWRSLTGDLGPAAGQAAATAGLLGSIGGIALLYRAGIGGMRLGRRRRPIAHPSRRFAHSLVPIALGYLVAHYGSLLLTQGQAVLPLLRSPLEATEFRIDYGIVSAAATWYLQVAALVAGHIAGLVLAHDRALALLRSTRAAVRAQTAMLAVMVGLTTLGLWLLSAGNLG
jgi:hypothetical protein